MLSPKLGDLSRTDGIKASRLGLRGGRREVRDVSESFLWGFGSIAHGLGGGLSTLFKEVFDCSGVFWLLIGQHTSV